MLSLDEIIEREQACGQLHGPFWQFKYLERAPERVRQQLVLARLRPQVVSGANRMDSPVGSDVNPSSFTPVTAAVETVMWSPSLWTRVASQDILPGTTYCVYFGGIYSNRTTTTPSSTWTPRWGTSDTPASNTILGASGALYSGVALTNVPMYGEFEFTVRTLGTSGSGVGTGFVTRGGASATAFTQNMGNTAATIDTTVDGGIVICHTWSAANASNTITPTWLYMKVRS